MKIRLPYIETIETECLPDDFEGLYWMPLPEPPKEVE